MGVVDKTSDPQTPGDTHPRGEVAPHRWSAPVTPRRRLLCRAALKIAPSCARAALSRGSAVWPLKMSSTPTIPTEAPRPTDTAGVSTAAATTRAHPGPAAGPLIAPLTMLDNRAYVHLNRRKGLSRASQGCGFRNVCQWKSGSMAVIRPGCLSEASGRRLVSRHTTHRALPSSTTGPSRSFRCRTWQLPIGPDSRDVVEAVDNHVGPAGSGARIVSLAGRPTASFAVHPYRRSAPAFQLNTVNECELHRCAPNQRRLASRWVRGR